MSVENLFFRKFLFLFSVSIMFVSCDPTSIEVPYYPIAKISSYEKESVKTVMRYDTKGLSNFEVYVNNSLVSSSNVNYSASKIYCIINDVAYDIKLQSTRGGVLAESISATTRGGSRLYYVEYWYDDEGRMKMSRVDGVLSSPAYCHYRYENNSIIIDDYGTNYTITLSSEDNLGNVCNVMDFSEAPMTTTYVINPDLYFLNVYGTPIMKLPQGQTITRSADNTQLTRVGKYYYNY